MIKILLRARLAAMLASMTPKRKKQDPTKKSGIGMLILMVLLYLYLGFILMIVFASAFFGLSQIYFDGNMEWMYFTMFVILSFAMMFIGSIFTAKSQLFEAKDNELLLAMPIRPRDILASRMLLLLFFNYLMEAVVAIPAGGIWLIFGNGSALSWIGFLLTFLTLPLFALAVSCLFAWLISLLTAKLPKNTFITVVAFLSFFFLYFYFINNIDQYLIVFSENSQGIAATMSAVMPLYWMGAGIANGTLWQLAVSLLIYALSFVLTCLILSSTFLKIVTTKHGTRQKKQKTARAARMGTLHSALLKREFSRLFSSSTYILNCGLAIPISIIAVVVAIVKKDTMMGAFSEFGIEGIEALICCVFVLALCFLNTTGIFTAPSVSLEGKTLWLLKSMPISGTDVLRAKLKMHLCLMIPTELLCGIALAIAFQPELPVLLLVLIVPSLYTVWVANIGLICNLMHPVFDWINEAQVVKQGVCILLTMLFSSLPILILAAGGFVLGLFSYWLTLFFVCALLLLGDLLTYHYLMHGGARRWESLN